MRKAKLIITIILCLILTGCKQKAAIPDISQIRTICNLATLECYYHNVAKSKKVTDSWFKKDREFWIEYTGVAKIGIDMSKVYMEIQNNKVKIQMPDAELLSISILEEDLNKNSYIKSKDGWIKNKITADDQTFAINVAQEEMSESVKNNKNLLVNAQSRAQSLIKNYINNLGEISNVDYQIEWIYDRVEDKKE